MSAAVAGHGPDHAAAMDAMYRGQRHIYDATRKFYLLGRDRLIRDLAPPSSGHVVEIGCGTARNLIAAARAWPEATFHGVDISTEMLDTARTAVARAGLTGRIALAQGDAAAFTAVDLGLAAADRVFMSYTLSMIPDWSGAIARGIDALAPGGQLHIVDFGQQERLPDAWRAALFAWLARFDVTPRPTLAREVGQLAAERNCVAETASLLRGYAWRARVIRPDPPPLR